MNSLLGHHDINSLQQLNDLALNLSGRLKKGDVVFLLGDLGCGKTTFTQFLLRHLGIKGSIKSPTYTLYENYTNEQNEYVHMDLYRLSNPEELYYLGIEDIFDGNKICLIEWPEKGQGIVPLANWTLQFAFDKLNRTLIITSL